MLPADQRRTWKMDVDGWVLFMRLVLISQRNELLQCRRLWVLWVGWIQNVSHGFSCVSFMPFAYVRTNYKVQYCKACAPVTFEIKRPLLVQCAYQSLASSRQLGCIRLGSAQPIQGVGVDATYRVQQPSPHPEASTLLRLWRRCSWLVQVLLDWSVPVEYIGYSGVQSESALVLYGVPQGSVLGPVLFILYTLRMSSI